MTNEEAKMFLDNLKVCIDEHPIVADWLVEIADRKTEQTEYDKYREKIRAHDPHKDWYEDEPQTDCAWK